MSEFAFPTSFPELETKRLILRQINAEDAEGVFRNFSDPEIAEWFFEQPLTEKQQAQEFVNAFAREFELGEGLTWAVVIKASDLFVGTCGYGSVEVGIIGDIGFDLAKDYWGQGLMTEALTSAINYGFDSLGLSKVEAHTYSTNARAIRLLEKVGFRVEKVSEEDRHFVLERDSWRI